MNKEWRKLFLSNFAGVFNDNLLKHAIIFSAISWSMPAWLSQSQLIALVSAALIIPYLILSPLGGRWAVHYSKQRVFLLFKLLEFPIMLLAALSFAVESLSLAIAAVFLMGIQSCLYSPSKYGLIRDIGGKEGSAKGSGVFEAMAFLGILTGTVVAAWLSDHYQLYLLVGLFLLMAAVGFVAVFTLKVKEQPPETGLSQQVHLNPVRFLFSSFRLAAAYKDVNKAVFGVSFFWLTGGMLQMNIVLHSSGVLNLPNTVTGMLMALTAVGIITGNWVAGLLHKRYSKATLILMGSAGMTLGFLVLSLFILPASGFAVTVMMIAFAGGFYQVPWLTTIQQADAGRRAGQLLAYMNVMVFIFVLTGSVLFSLSNFISTDNSIMVFFVLLLLNSIVLVATVLYFRRSSTTTQV